MDLDNNKIVEARSQIERTEAARNELGMPRTVFLVKDEGVASSSVVERKSANKRLRGEDAVDTGKMDPAKSTKFYKLKDWRVCIVCMGCLKVFIARSCLRLHVRIFFKCDI